MTAKNDSPEYTPTPPNMRRCDTSRTDSSCSRTNVRNDSETAIVITRRPGLQTRHCRPTRRPSRLILRLAADKRERDRDVLDSVGLHGVRVLAEHHKIRELAGGDGAFDLLF